MTGCCRTAKRRGCCGDRCFERTRYQRYLSARRLAGRRWTLMCGWRRLQANRIMVPPKDCNRHGTGTSVRWSRSSDGSVWPFVTGFGTLAEYFHHRPAGGQRHLYGVAAMNGLTSAGLIPEYMSGERAIPSTHGAAPAPLVIGSDQPHGQRDAGSGWRRVGGHPHDSTTCPARLDGSIRQLRRRAVQRTGTTARSRGETRISLSISGHQLRVVFSPAFAAGREAPARGGKRRASCAAGCTSRSALRPSPASIQYSKWMSHLNRPRT
jgi:hypothetical protein